uniref:Uncharacterized protein n=1 Tax=Sphaerodactylus townsendi TaxID=933632 RepID=A0ACB8E5V5_9SAUR
MGNIVGKTKQSKEIYEAGDTPMRGESWPQRSNDQQGKFTRIKAFFKKKKAVSFHGWEPWGNEGWRFQPHLTRKRLNFNLKCCSAHTNSSPSDGGFPEGAAEVVWSKDDYETPVQQEVSNSDLLRVKDSGTSYKETTSGYNRCVQKLQNTYMALRETIERYEQIAEEMEDLRPELKERYQKERKDVENMKVWTKVLMMEKIT